MPVLGVFKQFRNAPRLFSQGDYEEIKRWYLGHGETPPDEGWLPRHGRIVPEVAAGFLYTTDSKIGFLDAFIGNPGARAREVKQAIEEILIALAEDAKQAGLTVVFGNTKHASIAEIAKTLGGVAGAEKYFVLAKVL